MIYWGDEKIPSEEKVKTKDINYSKKPMGIMPKNYAREVPECLLYLWSDGSFRVEFPYGTHVGKGKSWSISQIRFKDPETPMLQMQYKSRRKRGRLLQKDAKRDRRGKNE